MYFKQEALKTLLHEAAHHFDLTFRVGRSRWDVGDKEKKEAWAERGENEEAARVILVELSLNSIHAGGLWRAEPSRWNRYDRPWVSTQDPGDACLLGSIQVAYGTPTKYEITIYRVSITRRGEELEMPPRQVTVHRFEEIWREGERAEYEIECESGTYVRSLIADLGDAYCLELRRTAIGPFAVDEAVDASPIPLADALARLREFENARVRAR